MKTLIERANDLLKIADKARSGPWIVTKQSGGAAIWQGPLKDNSNWCTSGGIPVIDQEIEDFDIYYEVTKTEVRNNMKAVCALRNDAPLIIRELLARIAELEAK